MSNRRVSRRRRYGEPGVLRYAAEEIRRLRARLGADAQDRAGGNGRRHAAVARQDARKALFTSGATTRFRWPAAKCRPSSATTIGTRPNSDHYNPACVQYPWAENAYFLFPSAYRHFPEPPKGKYGNDGLTDIQMAVSRDGIAWTRLSREPYVALGVEGEVDCRQLYMADGMIRRGGKVFQYYGGSRVSSRGANLRRSDVSARGHLPARTAARRVRFGRRGQ